MARSRNILVVLVLVLVLLAVAAAPGAAAAAAPAPVRGCRADVLAPNVALFCGGGLPAEYCCQALSHSAIVGGGALCLCRLASEAPLVSAALNATSLLRLYAACSGTFGHAGGGASSSYPPAPSPSACDGEGHVPAAAPPSADSTGCATAVLADQMNLFCRGAGGSSSSTTTSPTWPCCEAVVGSGRRGRDGVPCFCHVPQATGGGFGVGRISRIYAACVASGPGEGLHISGNMCKGPPHGDGNIV
nr:unnamed protein product [Digitaria exilis]